MANVMKEVAKALGLELGEEFSIGDTDKYVLLDDGLFKTIGELTYWQVGIENLLTGEWDVVKLPKPILDAKEKEYLSAVIRPKDIKDRLNYIVKRQGSIGRSVDMEFILIMLDDEYFSLPYFKKGTMYKGMKVDKPYSLEELGL